MGAHACQLAGILVVSIGKIRRILEKASLAGLRSILKGEIVCGVVVS